MLSDTKFALFIPIPKLKSYIASYRQRKQDLYPTHSSMYNWKYIAVYKKKKKGKKLTTLAAFATDQYMFWWYWFFLALLLLLLLFSRSVVFNPLQPHGLQHTF